MWLFIYALSFLSWLWVDHDLSNRAPWWIAIMVGQSLAWYFLFLRREKLSLTTLALSFSLALVAVSFTSPFFEDDFRRYQWDGNQLRRGVSVYAAAPGSSSGLAYSEYVTVYPPLAQGLFALFGKSLLLLSALGAMLFAMGYLRLTRSPILVLLVLQHPLVLKEWFQSFHYDVWVAAGLVWFLGSRSAYARAVWLAVVTQLKMVGLILVMQVSFTALPLFLVLLAVPWLLPWFGFTDFLTALSTFAKDWEMSSGVFRWTRELLGVEAARGVSLLLVGLAGWVTRRSPDLPRVYWILFAVVVFSPIVNPWYLTWILPLAVMLPGGANRWAIAAYTAVPCSYFFYVPQAGLSTERWWDLLHLTLLGCSALCWKLNLLRYSGEKDRWDLDHVKSSNSPPIFATKQAT